MTASAEMPVYLVPYDDSWPRRFQEEATLIQTLFRDDPIAVEHIGSTAIPGLAAKPVIDMMVLVDAIEDAQRYTESLAGLGYQYAPYKEELFPERRWHCKPSAAHRTHHLHLTERNSQFHFDHLLFRDFLRTHRSEATAYEALKTRLAAQYRTDREGYTDGKSAFVRAVLAKARASGC